MKKLLFIACLPIFLCMFQCEDSIDVYCEGSFYVKNVTDEALEICFSDSIPDIRSYVVGPMDSVLLRFVTTERIDGYPMNPAGGTISASTTTSLIISSGCSTSFRKICPPLLQIKSAYCPDARSAVSRS